MLENLSDYLSLFAMVGLVIACFIVIFTLSDKQHASEMKRREERYLSFLEDADNDYDESINEDEEL